MKRVVASLLFLFILVRIQAETPLVYIVDSYDREAFVWTREISSGLNDGFKELGIEITSVVRTLDAYNNPTEEALRTVAAAILDEISRVRPDLVICTDDDALEYVGMRIDDTPVVFCGINNIGLYLETDRIGTIRYPGKNLTGVYQKIYYSESMNLLRQLVPDAETVAILTDRTTTSRYILEDLEAAGDNLPLRIEDIVVSSDYGDWRNALERWHSDVDTVFLISANAVYDRGRLMSEFETLARFREDSGLPDMACWAYQVEGGILVSAADDGTNQGYYAAIKAAMILDGHHPGDLPITAPYSGVPALNLKRAEDLGIQVLPNLLALFVSSGVLFR